MKLFKLFGEVALKGGKAVTSQLKVIDFAAARTTRRLEAIPNKVKTEVEVKVDTDKAERRIGGLMSELGALQGGMMALGPAVVPAMASVAVAAGGIGSAFAAAGAGVAAFAAIAIPALGGIFESAKEVEKAEEKLAKADTWKEKKAAMEELNAVYGDMTAKERAALKAFQDFKSFWDGFVKSFQNPVLDVFIKGLGMLKSSLNQLKPVFELSINAVTQMLARLDESMKGQQMKTFVDFLTRNAGPAMINFGAVFGNVIQGIINILMAFEPVGMDMQTGLVDLTQRFADWSAGLANSQGFKSFVQYVQAHGPTLLAILGQVVDIVGQLVVSMAPLAPVVLDIITHLLNFVQWLLQLHPAAGAVLVGMFQLVGVFKLVSGGITGLVSGFNFLKSGVQTTGSIFKAVGAALRSFGTTVLTALRIGFTNVMIGIRMFGASLASLADVTLNALRVGFTWLMNGIRLLGPIIQSLATGALRMLISGFRGLITAFNVLRVAMMANPFVAIIAAVVTLVAIIIFNWDKIKAYLIPLWNQLKSAAISAWNALKAGVSSAVSAVTQFIKSAWNSAKSKVSSIWNSMKSTATSVFNSIKSVISSSMNAVKSVITSIWNGIKSITASALNSIKSTISSGIRSAYTTVKGYVSSFLSAGKGLMSALAKGISSGLSKAISAVKSGMAKVRSYLPFSPAKEGPLSDLDKSGESFFPTFASRMDRGLTPLLNTVASGMGETMGLLSPSRGPVLAGSVSPIGSVAVPATNIHFHGPVSMRNEEDIALLAKKIAEEQYKELIRRSRAQGRRG